MHWRRGGVWRSRVGSADAADAMGGSRERREMKAASAGPAVESGPARARPVEGG